MLSHEATIDFLEAATRSRDQQIARYQRVKLSMFNFSSGEHFLSLVGCATIATNRSHFAIRLIHFGHLYFVLNIFLILMCI